MRSSWIPLLGLAACWSAQSSTIVPAPPATAPPVECVPLVGPDLGFAAPTGWRVERRNQGVWDFTLLDGEAHVAVAVVQAKRFEKCTPIAIGQQKFGEPVPPLDPAFPDGYAVDQTQGGASGTEGAMVSDEACVHGDRGALYVNVYGHDAKFQPQIRALLVAIAEATDGGHACKVQR